MKQQIIINLIKIVLLIVPVFSAGILFAQEEIVQKEKSDSTKTYRIEIQDGSSYIGNILAQDSASIYFRTSLIPRIEIPRNAIASIVEVDQNNLKEGSYWFPNPNSTRYLFGPSAFPLNKGEGYYQNTYLFLNSFNVGVTNNISVGGGIELISTFGSKTPIFFLTPKASFRVKENFSLAGGVLYASIPEIEGPYRSNIGILYSVGTIGNIEDNFTFGLGWGFIDEEITERPILTFSGMTRIGPKASLITENWFVPADGYYGVISYGIRFFGEKLAVDLAFLNNRDIANAIAIGIPYVDFVVKF